jgi:uncharacterized protein (DUF169 family)
MEKGESQVTAIIEGDMEFRLAMSKAEEIGYELTKISESKSAFSILTKRTLIFKRKMSEL